MDPEKRKVSLRDYYTAQIDRIIAETLDKNDKNKLRQLTSESQIELESVTDFPPDTIEDLRAYCRNFCDLVILLSNYHLMESRKWNMVSAKTLVQVMIDKLNSEGESN